MVQKDFDPKHKIPFVVLIVLSLVIALISFAPARILFLMAFAYAISGPIGWLIRLKKGEETAPAFLPDEEDPAEPEKSDSNQSNPDSDSNKS